MIFFVFVFVYVFVYDHDENLEEDLEVEHSAEWYQRFSKLGLTDEQISKITRTRDSRTGVGVWRYNKKSTCVAYGDFEYPAGAPGREFEYPAGTPSPTACDRSEAYCSGKGKIMGSAEEQAEQVVVAILNGGLHPKCPLIY